MTSDGMYTNALYGFLAILFKLIEDVKPEYMVVAFDLKAPTARHKLYKGYKANRKGMPDELAEQMPVIKEILTAMNIDIVEKEGYEADDVLGTLSRYGEKQGLDVVILSGDRDTFQLATDKVTIRIPRTKGGRTETEEYDRKKIVETYGIEPPQLKDVKGLQGDTSDNIPGVPGVGEKTALSLIQRYGSIENLYEKIDKNEDDLKGKQREKIVDNKKLAEMSKVLGTINLEVPIDDDLTDFKVEEWDRPKVLEIFKRLKFNRYIDRFSLRGEEQTEKIEENLLNIVEKNVEEIKKEIKAQKEMTFYLETENDDNPEKIIKEKIVALSIYTNNADANQTDNNKQNSNASQDSNTSKNASQGSYYIPLKQESDIQEWQEILEDKNIKKTGMNLTKEYILLKQNNITLGGIDFDIQIAAYILNPSDNKLDIDRLAMEYLGVDLIEYMQNLGVDDKKEDKQINLFDALSTTTTEQELEEGKMKKIKSSVYVAIISKLREKTLKKLNEINAVELFRNIDIPTVEVLSDMQWNGMYVNKKELENFGKELTEKIETVTKTIYEMAGEEFNINSTKQLGEVLFEKMKLPVIKKTKSGYSTDVDVLEKLKKEDPIIGQILEYRQLVKLNSTYVEGLKPYINPKTNRIHSFFHQTITATGRISSTEPNLQNIPTRFELGKRVRKVFFPEEGSIYLDADYSQIELRVLAHVSEDEHMIQAFKNNEDIHKQAASKVFRTPIDEVSKEQRSNAKAVNFGIVYGISDFGLANQLGIPRRKAKQYIDEYLEQYSGIKNFMDTVTQKAKERGYVETLFSRRRYIPELKSNNYMVRQFGSRAAMNTPIQGTAADIMKIAMINVYKKLKEEKLKSKIVLQVHDEMLIETKISEIEQVKEIMKNEMENAIQLKVPLIVEISEATNWYDCK